MNSDDIMALYAQPPSHAPAAAPAPASDASAFMPSFAPSFPSHTTTMPSAAGVNFTSFSMYDMPTAAAAAGRRCTRS